ncbi:MAG: hypothetical protein V9F02_09280 [Chitinophagaceae bacterium]
MLIDVDRLVQSYYNEKPDAGNPAQAVSFGTSGHRGTSRDGTFTDAHIAAITQAIVEYRATQGYTGPVYLGKDTHALSGASQRTALEVLAGNGVTTLIQQYDEVTPTPVISHAILKHNRGRKSGLADGIIITPSHNPPEDGGFKYNPPNGGPADTDATGVIQKRANELLKSGNVAVKRLPYNQASKASTTETRDFVAAYVNELDQVIDMSALKAAKLVL